jgi:hypothetical protein
MKTRTSWRNQDRLWRALGEESPQPRPTKMPSDWWMKPETRTRRAAEREALLAKVREVLAEESKPLTQPTQDVERECDISSDLTRDRAWREFVAHGSPALRDYPTFDPYEAFKAGWDARDALNRSASANLDAIKALETPPKGL